MSNPIDVMQEYLVSLGFKVNNTQLDGMLKSLDKAKDMTNSVAGKMTKNLATGGVAIVSFIATATAATAKFLEAMADADMETEKLARRLWITEESARSLENVLNAMGEDLGSLNDIAMNNELRDQFVELHALSKQLGAPKELQDQLKFIRSISFEFKKMKLIANYTLQNVAFYLTKYLGKSLTDIKSTLSNINEMIIKYMPIIAEKIAKGLYIVIRLGETLFKLVYAIGNMIFSILDRLPGRAKLALGALAMAGFMALNPFTLIVGALVLLLLMLEDYYAHSQGKKSVFGGMWDSIDGIASKVSTITDEVDKLFQNLTGMSTFEATLKIIDGFLASIADSFKLIGDELDFINQLINGKLSFKEAFSKGGDILGRAFGISNLFTPTGIAGKLGEQFGTLFGSAAYNPLNNSGGVTQNKTNNMGVNINQTITTNDPVLAARESGRLMQQVLNKNILPATW